MKQMTFGKILSIVACVLVPSKTVADQAQYIYDDLGRWSQVIDGQGNVATYTYDAVWNLLSITRSTGGIGAPTITAFTSNTGNASDTVNVLLTGTNLTGAALATSNPGILVRNVVTTPTTITATFKIAYAAAALTSPMSSSSIIRLPVFSPCRSVTAVSVGVVTAPVKER